MSFPPAPARATGPQRGTPTVMLGGLGLGTALMLAPMAGVTNPPFRQLCREFGELALADMAKAGELGSAQDAHVHPSGRFAPAGLYVCEMITSRALVERSPESMRMIEPDLGDPVRSIQIYGVAPKAVGEAIRLVVGNGYADHIDLNFGCPVPKVTRRGGGSALPWKHDLFGGIVDTAVKAADKASGGTVPVTAKIRIGIDDDHETFRDAARICEQAGVAGLTLHARTTAQHYSGTARWEYISELVTESSLPVFGNGDVFEAEDALAMLESTGASGVVVGRGCQGRPWLFYDLVAALRGCELRMRPNLAQVCDIIMRHAELAVVHFSDERRAMREMRKHVGWYMRGFAVGGQLRRDLGLIDTVADLREKLNQLDLTQDYPAAASGPRGRAGGEKQPHLPEFWLDSHELSEEQRARIHEAELGISGG
ncbi:tRNA dihydrouridine synthase DusB [Trueperella pyogenes]|uniref:tRNA dihydrouridine synthase DusB n=1 Tax=Trueperella pyogenes TaxID=1661 RepID=UPI00345D7110